MAEPIEPIANLYQKALAKAELERRRIHNSCEHFIAEYVWIEDKTAPEKVSRFALWLGQVQALAVMLANRMVIIAKARQLGLTWLVLAYAVWRMITRAGFTVIAISKTEPDAIELVDFRLAEVILPRLPPWLIREKRKTPPGFPGLTWEASKHELTIYHPLDPETGAERLPSRFKALAASEDAGRSVTADLLLLDEWAKQQWAREIWTAAYPTVSAAGTDQQVIGLSTGEKGTLFEDVATNPEQYGFELVFLPWQTDPRRDDSWYAQQRRALPNSYRSEFPATLADAFAVGQGAFFSEWTEGHHQYAGWQAPKAWKRIGGYDPGFAGWACFKWYAMHPTEGWLRCYREYYATETTDVEQAKAIVAMSKYADGSREVIEYVAADTDAWTKNRGTGESTADVFRKHGLPMRQADKTLPVGWWRLHEWLRPLESDDSETPHSWLTFTADCPHTIRTYPGCKEAKSNPEDIDKATEHHCFVGETLVHTEQGLVPLAAVRPGDLVLTRQGYRKVLNHALTQSAAKVFTVCFSNGARLTGTADHPVWIHGHGFTAIRDLREGDVVDCAPNQCGSTASLSGGILSQSGAATGCIFDPAPARFDKAPDTFTKRFGKRLTALFRQAITSITRTRTRLTTTLTTWNAYPVLITCPCTENSIRPVPDIWPVCRSWLRSGTELRRADSGTQNTPDALRPIWGRSIEPVRNAARSTNPSAERPAIAFAPTGASQHGGGPAAWTTSNGSANGAAAPSRLTAIAQPAPVLESAVRVCDISPAGIAPVYDITVDEVHEFYANSVLVANCQDVDRYVVMSRPRPGEGSVIIPGGKPKRTLAPARGQQRDLNQWDDDDERPSRKGFFGR